MFDSVFSFLLSLIEGAYHTQRGVLYTLACAFALFVFFSWRIIQLLKEPPPRILYASHDLALFVFFSWRIIQLLKTLFSHDLYASPRFRPLCIFQLAYNPVAKGTSATHFIRQPTRSPSVYFSVGV